MLGRTAGILTTFFIAFGILIFSIFHSASVRYTFGQSPTPSPISIAQIEVDYHLPYPGRILPDSPFWIVKVIRDRTWLLMTTNSLKKAEISLLFANKRLASSKALFDRNKPDLALATLTRAEKYLEKATTYEALAREEGMETGDFLEKLSIAALKHQELILEMANSSPADVRGPVENTLSYSEKIYEDSKNLLDRQGRAFPLNPFE